jgi:hypothetical protein
VYDTTFIPQILLIDSQMFIHKSFPAIFPILALLSKNGTQSNREAGSFFRHIRAVISFLSRHGKTTAADAADRGR